MNASGLRISASRKILKSCQEVKHLLFVIFSTICINAVIDVIIILCAMSSTFFMRNHLICS